MLPILIIQTAVLCLIAALVFMGKIQGPMGPQGIQGPQGPQGIPGESSAPTAAAARSDLAEIFIHRGGPGNWHHHGWAQIGSEAYHDAMHRQNFAVKRPGESMDLGRQG